MNYDEALAVIISSEADDLIGTYEDSLLQPGEIAEAVKWFANNLFDIIQDHLTIAVRNKVEKQYGVLFDRDGTLIEEEQHEDKII
jgi:hypothetical protein